MNLLILTVVVIMLLAALAALVLPNMIAAVVSASVVSLGLTILFALLKAPDVALTEAAVGAALGSLILAIAIKRLGLHNIHTSTDGER